MASYIITFRLSNSESETYKERRDWIYNYFEGYIPFTKSDVEEEKEESVTSNKTKEKTTSTIFWQSFTEELKETEFDENGNEKLVGGIVYEVKEKLEENDIVLIIQLNRGNIIDIVRIRGKNHEPDTYLWSLLVSEVKESREFSKGSLWDN
jgi:hypothetical protein